MAERGDQTTSDRRASRRRRPPRLLKRAGEEGENPNIPAGYAYLGQCIDHAITLDPPSSLQRQNDPEREVQRGGLRV